MKSYTKEIPSIDKLTPVTNKYKQKTVSGTNDEKIKICSRW